MNSREIGNEYEKKAREYLVGLGYKICACNYYTRHGELDIVALDGNVYVFLEVKYRSSLRYGHPLEAINKSKIKSIRYSAKTYLYRERLGDVLVRFDVIGIIGDGKIMHVKNAF